MFLRFRRWWRLARSGEPPLNSCLLSPSPRPNSSQAHPRRVARVAKQLEREIGMLLLTDPALRAAVSPPSRERENSGSLTGIASVSEVELTSNLQLARVYVSVYADAKNRAPAMRALERLQPYVRRRCGFSLFSFSFFPSQKEVPKSKTHRPSRRKNPKTGNQNKQLEQLKQGRVCDATALRSGDPLPRR